MVSEIFVLQNAAFQKFGMGKERPYTAGDNSEIWRQSPYRGTVSVFRRQDMLKNSYIPKKLEVPRFGGDSPHRETV